MLARIVTIFAIIPLAVVSLKCYDYMRSSNINPNMIQHTSEQCPYDAQFCMKSFVENRDMNGFVTWLESRNCGNFQTCQREGCFGESYNTVCCCRGDYCNGATEKVGYVAMLAPMAVYALNRFAA